jgi:hypothetical protein
MSFWTSLFSIIGIVFVLFLIYFIVRKYWSGKSEKKDIDFPSDNYMRTVGGLCPDYWVPGKMNKNNKTHECINKFNIPVNETNNSKCKEPNTNKYIFNTISKWPPGKKVLLDNGDKFGICSWIDKCGPKSNIRASWIGMDRACAENNL